MTVMLRTFVIAFAVAFGPLAVHAQTTETGEETATETDGTSVPGTDLAIGQPVNEGGVGRTYVKDDFGDWDLRCIKTESGNDPCQLYQLLVDGQGNSVAEINLFVVNENEQIVGGATIVTPLETLLTANLRLAVDGGEARVYPFSFCRTIGCFSRLGLTEAEVEQFRKGTTANVVIVPAAAPDQTVQLKASLSGFTAGWNALVEVSKPAGE